MCLMQGLPVIEGQPGIDRDVCVHGQESTPPASPSARAVSRDIPLCDFAKTKRFIVGNKP